MIKIRIYSCVYYKIVVKTHHLNNYIVTVRNLLTHMQLYCWVVIGFYFATVSSLVRAMYIAYTTISLWIRISSVVRCTEYTFIIGNSLHLPKLAEYIKRCNINIASFPIVSVSVVLALTFFGNIHVETLKPNLKYARIRIR